MMFWLLWMDSLDIEDQVRVLRNCDLKKPLSSQLVGKHIFYLHQLKLNLYKIIKTQEHIISVHYKKHHTPFLI